VSFLQTPHVDIVRLEFHNGEKLPITTWVGTLPSIPCGYRELFPIASSKQFENTSQAMRVWSQRIENQIVFCLILKQNKLNSLVRVPIPLGVLSSPCCSGVDDYHMDWPQLKSTSKAWFWVSILRQLWRCSYKFSSNCCKTHIILSSKFQFIFVELQNCKWWSWVHIPHDQAILGCRAGTCQLSVLVYWLRQKSVWYLASAT